MAIDLLRWDWDFGTYIEFQNNSQTVRWHWNDVGRQNNDEGDAKVAWGVWGLLSLKEKILNNIPDHKTLEGKSEKDRDAEEESWNVNEVIVPAVVLQKITCQGV